MHKMKLKNYPKRTKIEKQKDAQNQFKPIYYCIVERSSKTNAKKVKVQPLKEAKKAIQ